MSIFSSIRKSRQSAKEHKNKMAEQQQKEAEAAPYRHVPTHAASDAIASAPPSWREADRPKIVEQNRRRSEMAASGHSMGMPSIPRVGSSLSYVSYPGNASPGGRLPRAYSYSGVPSAGYGSRDVIYSLPDVPDLPDPHRTSWKGKEVVRSPASERRQSRPPSSKGDVSPVRSSDGSATSQDDLEMKPKASGAPQSPGPDAKMHRLAPRNQRRGSAGSVDLQLSGQHVSGSRDSRPPASTRGFNAIPSSATPGALPAGSLPGTLPVKNGSAGWRGSTSSLAGSTSQPTSPLALSSVVASTTPFEGLEFPFPKNAPASPQAEVPLTPLDFEPPKPAFVSAPKDRRAVTTRFTELERIESAAHPREAEYTHEAPVKAIDDSTPRQAVNALPEAPQPVTSAPAEKTKGKKLVKGGGKLVKKHRWSMTKNNAVTA